MDDFYKRFGLRRLINARGPATVLGSSRVNEKIRKDISDMLGLSVEMWELQRKASEAIVKLTGAQAGCVVGCSAAGMAIATAAAITEGNMGWVKALPTVLGPKKKIVIQKGHVIGVGDTSISQMVGITGAEMVEAGEALDCSRFYLESALTPDVAAAIYILGEHFSHNLLTLETFIRICKSKNVPVIVDAAYETDFRHLHQKGADLVVHSGQKWLGGATAGIIAGKKELVHACYMNDMGIGRPMKVGKEGVIGVISAIESWLERDGEQIASKQAQLASKFRERIAKLPGLSCTDRKSRFSPSIQLALSVDKDIAGIEAWEIVSDFAKGNPVIRMHEGEVSQGTMVFDLSYMQDGDETIIADRIEKMIEDRRNNPVGFLEKPDQLTRMDRLYETHRKWLDVNPRGE